MSDGQMHVEIGLKVNFTAFHNSADLRLVRLFELHGVLVIPKVIVKTSVELVTRCLILARAIVVNQKRL